MRSKVWITVLVSVFALPALAAAHNLGHVFLPDGACLEVGSAREAPLASTIPMAWPSMVKATSSSPIIPIPFARSLPPDLFPLSPD